MSPNYQDFRKKFTNEITNSKRILITSHFNPDDDSISSVLGMYAYLKEFEPNKEVDIFYSGEFQKRWSYFENFSAIQNKEDISEIIEDYDTIIFVDGSQFHRFSNEVEKFKKSSVKKICIDHHASIVDNFDLSIIDSARTSCSEMIYKIFYSDQTKINPRVCEIILLGILGDTGTFKFVKSSQSEVFPIVQKLISDGNIDIQLLKSKYEGYPIEVFELAKKVISNAKVYKIPNVPDCIVTFIDFKDVKDSGLTDTLVSEATHIFASYFSTSIKNIGWSMIFYPQNESRIKVSMRSLPGSTNVRVLGENLAKKYDGQGGGHDRAGGFVFLNVSPKDGIQKYIDLVIEFIKGNGVEMS
jgi:phosphoesterase RecJ-like protein